MVEAFAKSVNSMWLLSASPSVENETMSVTDPLTCQTYVSASSWVIDISAARDATYAINTAKITDTVSRSITSPFVLQRICVSPPQVR